MLALAQEIWDRDHDVDLRDLREAIRPFVLRIREQNTYHAWGKNTPGKAATPDPEGESPWEQNNVRGLEDFDDGNHL